MEENDFYAIVLKSGQFSKCKRLEEFKLSPESLVECFLYARYDHTFHGPSNTTSWYQFFFVDREGNPTTYRIGNFEVSYLGLDNGYTNFFGRSITIHDCSTDKYYECQSNCWYYDFIHHEIKPLLERLNKCSDEDDIVKELDTVLSYDALQDKVNSLQTSYDDLKEKYDLMKTKVNELLNSFETIKELFDNA